MSSWEWRCSWSSANRRCSNYVWVINNLIAYYFVVYLILETWRLTSTYIVNRNCYWNSHIYIPGSLNIWKRHLQNSVHFALSLNVNGLHILSWNCQCLWHSGLYVGWVYLACTCYLLGPCTRHSCHLPRHSGSNPAWSTDHTKQLYSFPRKPYSVVLISPGNDTL